MNTNTLPPSFDLHFDVKTLDQLEVYIDQYSQMNPQYLLRLMLAEIKTRNLKIEELEVYENLTHTTAALNVKTMQKNKDLEQRILCLNAIIRISKELEYDRLTGDEPETETVHIPEPLSTVYPEMRKIGRPVISEFCRSCGASIPHRPGEGRCPECAHHDPEHT